VSTPCMIGANMIEIVIAPRLAGAAVSPLTASPLTVGLPLNRACDHRRSELNLNDMPLCCPWLQTECNGRPATSSLCDLSSRRVDIIARASRARCTVKLPCQCQNSASGYRANAGLCQPGLTRPVPGGAFCRSICVIPRSSDTAISPSSSGLSRVLRRFYPPVGTQCAISQEAEAPLIVRRRGDRLPARMADQ